MGRDFVRASTQRMDLATALATAVPLTFACWFQPDDTTSSWLMSLTLSGAGGAHQFTLSHQSSKVVASAYDTAEGSSSVGTFTAGDWVHGAAVFASTTSRTAYINGTAGTANTTSITPVGINKTGFCWRQDGSGYFDGRMGEAAMWNVALTTEEVGILANGYCPLFIQPASLLGYWPLIGKYSPEIDVENANSLTLTNTPTAGDHPPILRQAPRLVLGGPYNVNIFPKFSIPEPVIEKVEMVGY